MFTARKNPSSISDAFPCGDFKSVHGGGYSLRHLCRRCFSGLRLPRSLLNGQLYDLILRTNPPPHVVTAGFNAYP